MSASISPETKRPYGLKRVCRVWGLARSSVYQARKQRAPSKSKRGPAPRISDERLIETIKRVIRTSKFTGEGHRNICPRLRRDHGICVGRNRVLRLMREQLLLSPYRSRRGKTKTHDGRIVTDAPHVLWATDAVKIWTEADGWIWYFGVTDHWNSECLGWHVTKKGDRYAAIEALKQAIRSGCRALTPGVARGINLRPDHGSVFTSKEYRNEAKYWGLGLSDALVGEPETNGVEERFHRTMKEQCVHGRIFKDVHEVREVIGSFINDYNNEWILEKLGYKSPREAREEWKEEKFKDLASSI